MTGRARAALVIARQQAFETLLSPGLYVTFALGLILGVFVVTGFAGSIDSSGFNPALNSVYDLLARSLTGIFGTTFVAKLFAEGPFLLALLASFLPVFLFLAISSVFRFGQEKSAGAVELLTYGPADGTAYLLASFIKDAGFTVLSLILITLFLWAAAALGNLVLGPLFLALLPVLLCVSLAIFSYGILCSILSSNASSALAAFLGILVLFFVVLTGSFSIASASVRTVSSVAAGILQWFSPFFYASICVRAAQGGAPAALLGGIGLLLVLAAALLSVSHLAIRRRGVRA